MIPKSITFSHGWMGTRKLVIPYISSVIDIGKAWSKVKLEEILLTFSHKVKHQSEFQVGRLKQKNTKVSFKLKRDLTHQLDIIPTGISEPDYELLKLIIHNKKGILSEICNSERGKNLQSFLRPFGDIPVLMGRNISRFQIQEIKQFINLNEVPRNKLKLANKGDLVFQNIVAHIQKPKDHICLIGAITNKTYALLDTVNIFSINSKLINANCLLGYLSSNLINWFIYICIFNRAHRTMHFDNWVLDKIPIPNISKISPLSDIVDILIKDHNNAQIWTELNSIIYNTFSIPKTLQNYIEANYN